MECPVERRGLETHLTIGAAVPTTEYVFACVSCRKKISLTTQRPQTSPQLHNLLLNRDWFPLDVFKRTAQCKKCQTKVTQKAVEAAQTKT